MSLRWRSNGALVCGAKSDELEDDCYIDDRLHYHLSVILKIIVPDNNEENNGLWYWARADDHVCCGDSCEVCRQIRIDLGWQSTGDEPV